MLTFVLPERSSTTNTNEENGLVLRRYWTTACQRCAIQASLHHRQRATDHAMGTRTHPRSRSTPARRASGEDAPAARDGRASPRHDQGSDGSYALPDENAPEGRLRDGAARAALQSHARHEHHGHPAAHNGNAGIVKAEEMTAHRSRPRRLYTSATTFSHMG